MCEQCLEKFHGFHEHHGHFPQPHEIISGPIPLGVIDGFNRFRNAWDNYVTHLGSAALEHGKKPVGVAGKQKGEDEEE